MGPKHEQVLAYAMAGPAFTHVTFLRNRTQNISLLSSSKLSLVRSRQGNSPLTLLHGERYPVKIPQVRPFPYLLITYSHLVSIFIHRTALFHFPHLSPTPAHTQPGSLLPVSMFLCKVKGRAGSRICVLCRYLHTLAILTLIELILFSTPNLYLT